MLSSSRLLHYVPGELNTDAVDSFRMGYATGEKTNL